LSLAFKPKSFLRPKNGKELSGLLKRFGEHGRILAGGTGIYELAHRGLLADLEALIDISELRLSYVKAENEFLKIGAATTMSSLHENKMVATRPELAALRDALKAIQPLQVKNVATVGGAICTALPFFDLPVALLALNSIVRLGPGSSQKPLSAFVQGYFAIELGEGEFVKEIEVPMAADGQRRASAFQKFAITHDDWALVNCGVALSVDNRGRISDPVVFFGGGVGEKAVRTAAIESRLDGKPADSGELKSIFEEGVSKELDTVTDVRASSEYRRKIAAVIGRRTVLSACERAQSRR
jgi:aerobic carbon-monoxide dehydrogenase medium subunit